MKAVLHDRPFSDPAWVFERKLDGIRCLSTRSHAGVTLEYRTGQRLNGAYSDPRYVGLREDKRPEEVVRE